MKSSSHFEEAETNTNSKAPKRKASFLVADLIAQDSDMKEDVRKETSSEDELIKSFSGFIDKGW